MGRLTEKRVFNGNREEVMTLCVDNYICHKEYNYDYHDRVHFYIEGEAVDKLAHYEDLEEQGLLLKLKHKIGDVIYYISPFDYVIEARRISMITQKSDKSMKYRLSSECGVYDVTEKDLEKEYYLTKAEAEKALEEMEK